MCSGLISAPTLSTRWWLRGAADAASALTHTPSCAQFDIADIRPLDLASVYPLIAQRRPLYNSSQGQTVGWISECCIGVGGPAGVDRPPSCHTHADRNKVFLLSLDVRSHVRRHRVHLVRTNRPHWYFLLLNPHLSEAVSFYQLDKLTNIDMFRVFVELYISQRSPELQQRVDAQAAAIAGGNPRPLLVGVQIRTGGDGGWGDPRRHPPESAVQFAEQSLRVCKQASAIAAFDVNLCFVGCQHSHSPARPRRRPACWRARPLTRIALPRLLEQVDNRCAIYVTSDSLTAQGTFVEHVKRQAPNVSVTVAGGEPVHLDKSAIPANDTSTLLKSFVDYEMLRRMDHLVISRSGFGETAAWAGAIPTDQLKLPPRARPPPPGSAPFNASFFAYDSVVGPDVPKQIQLMHASGQPISFPAYDSELVPPPPSSPPAPAPAPL